MCVFVPHVVASSYGTTLNAQLYMKRGRGARAMCDANDTHRVARRTVPAASTGWAAKGSWRWLWAAWGVWGRPEGTGSRRVPCIRAHILDTLVKA